MSLAFFCRGFGLVQSLQLGGGGGGRRRGGRGGGGSRDTVVISYIFKVDLVFHNKRKCVFVCASGN